MTKINSSKVDSKIQEKLSAFPEPRFLHSRDSKFKLLFGSVFPSGPLLLLIAYMGRAGKASLWPLAFAMIIFAGWALFVGIAHKSISEEEFSILSAEEKMNRLYYESMWWRIFQGGYALIVSGALVWGIVEIIIRFEFLIILPIFLGLYFLFLFLCFFKQKWIAKVYSEGAERPSWVKTLIAVSFGIIGGMPILGGVARMVQVSRGIEATQHIFMPILVVTFLILAGALVVLGTIAFLIAQAQYQKWQKL